MGSDAALKKGDLKFTLHGEKLRGSWVLVRTPRGWLLMKHRDRYASTQDVIVAKPASAVSGKMLADIARAKGGNVEKAAKGDLPPKQ
jgi:bifunctional non-homologous end joining protein LigD